ncbi:hypothetical protein [Metallosphaera tengchongensis]|nr:hypothetical protein [Metallosphaera tengchongensis]
MVLPSGQLLYEEREPIYPAIPEESIRIVTVRLLPNGAQQKNLGS